MDVLYIKTPADAEKVYEFNRYWGISQLCSGENTFLWNGKKYKFDCQHLEPSVTMKCIDDNTHITFGVSSSLRDESSIVE